MTNVSKMRYLLGFLVALLLFATAVPAWAHGGEEDEADSIEIVEEGSGENDDRESSGTVASAVALPLAGAMPVWVGLLSSVLLSGGVGSVTRPRPNLLMLFGLALIGMTGGLHLVGGLIWGDLLLVLNGVGYFALGLAWAVPFDFIQERRRLIPLLLIGYTLVTIVGYFALHSQTDTVGLISKGVEMVLIVVLGISLLQESGDAEAI